MLLLQHTRVVEESPEVSTGHVFLEGAGTGRARQFIADLKRQNQ